jgi:hypothetical protein
MPQFLPQPPPDTINKFLQDIPLAAQVALFDEVGGREDGADVVQAPLDRHLHRPLAYQPQTRKSCKPLRANPHKQRCRSQASTEVSGDLRLCALGVRHIAHQLVRRLRQGDGPLLHDATQAAVSNERRPGGGCSSGCVQQQGAQVGGFRAAPLTALVSSSRTNLRVYSHSECDVFSPLMALPLAAGTGAAGPAAPLGAATACAEPAAAPPCTLPFWLPPWALPSEVPRPPLPEKGVPSSAADAEVAELGRAVGVPHLRSRHSIAMPGRHTGRLTLLAHVQRCCSMV